MKLPLIGKVDKPPRWLLALVLTVLLGGGGYFGFRFYQQQQKPKRQKIRTELVKTQDITLRISASGSVVPLQEVNLSPKNSGRLAQLFVDQGDRVEQGQIIARMDDREIQAQIEQATANIAQAEARLALTRAGTRTEEIAQSQAQVDAAQSQLNLARERSIRYLSLAQQGAISRDQLDERLTNERNAQANLEQAQRKLEQLRNGARPEEISQNQAQLAQAKAALKAIQVQATDTIIRAPFSGVITQKYANVGSFVTPTTSASSTSSATSTSIVAIASNLEILAKVPERDIGQIRLNQKVEIKADAFPGKKFQGKVRLIAPAAVIEQNVTSFQVRITLETGQNELRSGMNVDLTFLGQTIENALVVPTVAIVTEKGKVGVLMADNQQQPEFRPITIGSTMGEQTQVIEGLKEGESVIVYRPKDRNSSKDSGGMPIRFR
jgi:HlyD family secretion protein